MANITSEEKIDYIYSELKKQKRNSNMKMFFKIIVFVIILFYVYKVYSYWYQNLLQDLLDLILPAVQDSVQGVMDQNKDGLIEAIKDQTSSLSVEDLKQKASDLGIDY